LSDRKIDLSDLVFLKKKGAGSKKGKVYVLEVTGELPSARNIIIKGDKK
jgi:hypothetical protein